MHQSRPRRRSPDLRPGASARVLLRTAFRRPLRAQGLIPLYALRVFRRSIAPRFARAPLLAAVILGGGPPPPGGGGVRDPAHGGGGPPPPPRLPRRGGWGKPPHPLPGD